MLADRDLAILTTWKAVEGLSGVAVLYTIFAVLLTCFLGGKTFFAFLGVVFDVLFAGAFIAIAVLTRDGASSCSGFVNTPLGRGQSDSKQGFSSDDPEQGNEITYAVSLGTACRLTTACFAVAIIGAVLFLISALVQVALGRHHKKEKRFGPSPRNGYTRGSGVKFFGRKKARKTAVHDPEMAGAAAPAGTLAPGAADYRPSHDTAYTGSTVAAPGGTYESSHKPLSGGYHTAPTGTYNTPATNY